MAFDDILNHLAGYIENELESERRELEVFPEPGKPAPVVSLRTGGAPRQVPVARQPVAMAAAQVVARPRASEASPRVAATDGLVEDGLRQIAIEADACRNCGLHKGRNKGVPGQGSSCPEILFVGEGPGEDEDRQGQAFVGKAGQLLTQMIEAMGYTRDQVFIANIVKCRPPGDRKPEPSEMDACLPFLRRQIALLKPKVIIALGGTAMEGLVPGLGEKITKVRGKWLTCEGIDLMPTFHPSYLLHMPSSKREAWEDLKEVLRFLGRTPPQKKATA